METTINKKAWWILLSTSILAIMIQIDYTAVNMALPKIASTVNSNLTTIQWVLSAYVLTWAAFVITAGKLADIYGKRRVFIIGTLIFTIASILTGFSSTATQVIACRVLQGFGGALFVPPLYTLVFGAFPKEKQGMALGVLTAAIAFGMTIGPTIGGAIIKFWSWEWLFFINAPLGLVSIAIILFAADKEPRRLSDEPMDYIGAFLLAIGVGGFIFSLSEIEQWGLNSPTFYVCILISIFSLVVFAVTQAKRKHPLLSLHLLKNKAFVGCLIVYVTLGYNFATVLIIGGLYLQNILSYTAYHAGFVFLALTLVLGVLSPFAGNLGDKIGFKTPVVIGTIATAISVLLFSLISKQSGLTLVIPAFMVAGLGLGLSFPSLNTAMMRVVSDDELSTASGTFTMFGCFGNTIGLIASSLVLVTFAQHKIFEILKLKNMTLTMSQTSAVNTLINSTHYSKLPLLHNGFNPEKAGILMGHAKTSFVYAMSNTMVISMAVALIGTIVTIYMINVDNKL